MFRKATGEPPIGLESGRKEKFYRHFLISSLRNSCKIKFDSCGGGSVMLWWKSIKWNWGNAAVIIALCLVALLIWLYA